MNQNIKIKIEIYGIEPIKDKTFFNNLFERINKSLLSETIDKFSEKFISTNMKNRPNAVKHKLMDQLVKDNIKMPFQMNDQDMKYICQNNKKIYMVFPLKDECLSDKFYFLQIFTTNLQSFLIPTIYQKNQNEQNFDQ